MRYFLFLMSSWQTCAAHCEILKCLNLTFMMLKMGQMERLRGVELSYFNLILQSDDLMKCNTDSPASLHNAATQPVLPKWALSLFLSSVSCFAPVWFIISISNPLESRESVEEIVIKS